MKFVIVMTLAVVALVRADDFYDSKYDNFDIDEVTGNERLLKAYANCFISGVKCTPEGIEFKKWIPEASQSSCGKCTEKQKVLVSKTIKALQSKLPEEWNSLIKIHDPEEMHQEELKTFLATY